MTMTETAGKEEGAPVRHKPDFYASENKRRWAVDLFKHGYGYTKAGRFRVQIAANQLRYCEELRSKVVDLRTEGLSWRKISEMTQVPVSTCRKWVRGQGAEKTED